MTFNVHSNLLKFYDYIIHPPHASPPWISTEHSLLLGVTRITYMIATHYMRSVHIQKSPILLTSPHPAVIQVCAKGTALLWWGCWGWSWSCDTWADRAGVDISALHWKDKAHCFPRHFLESRVPKAGVPVPPVVTASVQTWHMTDGTWRAHSEDRFFYFAVACGVKMNCLCFSSWWCLTTFAKAKFSTGLVVTSLFSLF